MVETDRNIENRARFRRGCYINTALRGRDLPASYRDWESCPEDLKAAWRESVRVMGDTDGSRDIDAVMKAAQLENDARNAEIDNLRWQLGL